MELKHGLISEVFDGKRRQALIQIVKINKNKLS